MNRTLLRSSIALIACCLLPLHTCCVLLGGPPETKELDTERKGLVVTGWDPHLKYERGTLLLGELNCVACHAPGKVAEHLTRKQSPILAEVGARVTPQYLRRFLANPHQAKPGTPMPDVLHGRPEKERARVVDDLVHYLVSLGGPIDQRSSGASKAQIARGEDLYHTIGCVSCHSAFAPPPKHKKDPLAALREDPTKKSTTPSVPLGDLASKTTVEALAQFLDNPLHVRPAGRMPWLHLEPGEAKMLAAYLLREQYDENEKAAGVGLGFAYYQGRFGKVPNYDKLKPMLKGEARTFDLAAVSQKLGRRLRSNFAVRFQGLLDITREGTYRFWTKSDDGSVLRISGKLVVNNDGIHSPREQSGTIKLKPGKHPIEVSLIQGGGGYELSVHWQPPGAARRSPIPSGVLLHSAAAMIPKGIVEFKVDQARAQRGAKLFGTLGCASCHRVSREVPSRKTTASVQGKPLGMLDPTGKGGCLSESPSAGRPRFALNAAQRKALRQAVTRVKDLDGMPKPQARVDQTMAALRCYACHERQGKGGPSEKRFQYFVYTSPVDLGDEGRRPPALDVVGGKLTQRGFEEALFLKAHKGAGERYRSFMATRMPAFGKDNVGQLPRWFAEADAGKVPGHKPAFSPRLVDDGRRLVGSKILVCINCHSWGGLRAPGAEGVDLVRSVQRVQPGWFHDFLINPQKYRPRTRMPSAWPMGKSLIPEIQDGDMHKQIDAIWSYLSVGLKGGMPPGLSPNDKSLLVPTTEPIVFRTFLDGVGAHTILVGFRQRTHLAFDANRVRSVLAWTGDFISTKPSWQGRAGQYAKIQGANPVTFPDGPTLAHLTDLKAPWPSDLPRKGKLGSSRTPPGWRYLGYRYDEQRVPTFLYRVGSVDVEEKPTTRFHKKWAYLQRHFLLRTSEKVASLYLRVATGLKIVESEGIYVIDQRHRYRITSPTAKPMIRKVGNEQELLVPIRFTAARDGKAFQAEVAVELMW